MGSFYHTILYYRENFHMQSNLKLVHDTVSFLFFFRFSLFLERGREGEREGEKHQCVGASHIPPTGDLA